MTTVHNSAAKSESVYFSSEKSVAAPLGLCSVSGNRQLTPQPGCVAVSGWHTLWADPPGALRLLPGLLGPTCRGVRGMPSLEGG